MIINSHLIVHNDVHKNLETQIEARLCLFSIKTFAHSSQVHMCFSCHPSYFCHVFHIPLDVFLGQVVHNQHHVYHERDPCDTGFHKGSDKGDSDQCLWVYSFNTSFASACISSSPTLWGKGLEISSFQGVMMSLKSGCRNGKCQCQDHYWEVGVDFPGTSNHLMGQT